MKVYKFFKKPTEEMKNIPLSEFSLQQKYPLYALTVDKKLAKKFRKGRNMDLFIEKVDDIEREYVDEYLRAKRDRLLDTLVFESYVFGKGKPKYISVVLTDSEFNLVSEYGDTGQILNYIPYESWISTIIFSENVRRILNGVYYEKSMNFAQAKGINEDGYLNLPIRFDLFGIFLLTYKDTFSNDFFNTIKCMDEYEGSNVIHS